ncbi:hypothetical protein NL50_12805 [Clostridium acetobutylicum]|nr:hypothetical protein NL50_12805 [Clostridium acetobutylicum]
MIKFLMRTNKKVRKFKKKTGLKRKLEILYLAYRRKDVPWYAKLIAIIVVGYVLSPIDLIPDFIPFVGYLDDLIIVPIGISLAIRLIPKEVFYECSKEAEEVFKEGKPKSWFFGVLIIIFWIAVSAYFLNLFLKRLYRH